MEKTRDTARSSKSGSESGKAVVEALDDAINNAQWHTFCKKMGEKRVRMMELQN
jgi:hypothetical protein